MGARMEMSSIAGRAANQILRGTRRSITAAPEYTPEMFNVSFGAGNSQVCMSAPASSCSVFFSRFHHRWFSWNFPLLDTLFFRVCLCPQDFLLNSEVLSALSLLFQYFIVVIDLCKCDFHCRDVDPDRICPCLPLGRSLRFWVTALFPTNTFVSGVVVMTITWNRALAANSGAATVGGVQNSVPNWGPKSGYLSLFSPQ